MPAPSIDIFAQPRAQRPVQQQTGQLLLLGSLGVGVLVLVLAWVAWSIIAGGPTPPPPPRPTAGTAEVREEAKTAVSAELAGSDGSTRTPTGPLPDVPEAGVVGTVAAAFRTLPKRPSDLAVDLLGKDALSTIDPHEMAWSGSSLFSLNTKNSAVEWYLAPAAAGPIHIDGWIAMHAPTGSTESTVPLQLTLPVSAELERCIQVPWPMDGTYHRLRCWASPTGPVGVAVGDTVLAEDSIKRRKDSTQPKIGLWVWEADMRIGSLRIFGTGDFVRMQSRVEASKEVLSPGDRLASMELHDAPRPVPGVFRPYEPGCIIDPFALGALQADPMARQLAEQQAAFVARRLRPFDQGECDLAARLLWLAQCLDPGSAQLVAVRAALAAPGTATPVLPALSKNTERELQEGKITCVVPYSYGFKGNREMRLLCQDAAWFMVPHHISGTLHAHPEERCDWPLLASLGRGLDENGQTWRLDFHRLVRSTEGRWSYPKGDGDQFQATNGGAELQSHTLVAGSKPDRDPSMNASIRVLARGEGDPYLVPDHTLWGDGELAVECHGTGVLELVPIADPGQVLARIQIRLVPPFEQTPALVVAGLDKPGMSARLYAMKPRVPPPQAPGDPKFEVDLARAFTPWRIWIERKGGDLSWQVWGGSAQAGKVTTPGPTALLFRPAPGAGLGITRFLSRAPVARGTGPQDSFTRIPLGEYRCPVPTPPSTEVAGCSPFVLTAGVRNTVTLRTNLDLSPGQTLWALEVQARRPWPTRRWLAVDESGKRLVEINAAVPPKDRFVHPGFALQVVGPAGAPARDVQSKTYEVHCQPPHAGEFLLTDKVEPNGWSDVSGHHLKWNTRLVVVPAKRGWDPANWCRGLQDAAVRGRPERYDLVAVLRAMSTDWDPDSLWQPPNTVRPATGNSPKVVVPIIVDQSEKPDAP